MHHATETANQNVHVLTLKAWFIFSYMVLKVFESYVSATKIHGHKNVRGHPHKTFGQKFLKAK